MATTTNFGWTTPDDTDLVKDGAAAIRTLGSSIDTSLVDLKGGTTGQNLRKASNTDLDFTFAGDATNTVVDAEGDLLVGDSADTLQRLAIGTTGQVLTADTSIDGKIKWSAPVSGGMTLLSTTTLSGVTTTISGISQDYTNLHIIVEGVTGNTANSQMRLRPNDQTTLVSMTGTFTGIASNLGSLRMFLMVGSASLRTDANNAWTIEFDNYASTTAFKPCRINGRFLDASSAEENIHYGGVFKSASALTSLVFDYGGTNTFAGGTVRVYGVK